MGQHEGIFPTFFLSGFECSTFLWGKDKKRRDLNAELRHYEHADEDYAMLPALGIAVAREGVPWPLVDKGEGAYDFSCIDGFLAPSVARPLLTAVQVQPPMAALDRSRHSASTN